MKVLIIGASGQLGKVLSPYFPDSDKPSHIELDLLHKTDIDYYLAPRPYNRYDKVIVLAGVKNQDSIEKLGRDALRTNILGIGNVVDALFRVSGETKLVYVSTEYVYPGTEGNYTENSPVLPKNKYIWSKIGAESCIHMMNEENYLIIRCAFSTKPWHRKDAYVDQWTSREEVSVIAQKIAFLIKNDAFGTYNVGSKRTRLYDYASSISDSYIERAYLTDHRVPRDTSMCIDKYNDFVKEHTDAKVT